MVARKDPEYIKGYNGFCCRVTGAAHQKADIPVQDNALFEKHNGFTVACVCDGHGGDDYVRSQKGSELACKAAAQCLSNSEFIEAMRHSPSKRKEEELILQLKKSIIFLWGELIRDDVKHFPFTDDELSPCREELKKSFICGENTEIAYGTTLICAVAAKDFFLALQIGDGTVVIMNKNSEMHIPMPEDERCFGNITSSICMENALECTRHYFTRELPQAVFLASDGVDKSFSDYPKMFEFYLLLYNSITEKGESAAASELEDFLPRLSQNGSGDDISVAVMIKE